MPGLVVAAGCLRGEPGIEAIARTSPRPVAVVPLLMAEGFILDRLRELLAGIDGLTIARTVGTHPLLARVVAEAAEATTRARGWRAQEVVLVLAAHGTPRHPGSGEAAAALALRVRETAAWAAVETAFLEQAPLLGVRLSALAVRKVVVVGLFVDAGPHGKDDVEEALAAAPGPVAYTGPIGAAPAIRRILRERAGLG
ncbi:MAG: hypothetical protein K6T74_06945 [Geminicoccaceae bacterium]|nr:hypothetical protein [Geminicoccaceae bacterium]